MTISEAIRARRSIRKYKPGAPIQDAQIEKLLEAAMMAPSAGNGRPWEFIVVKDREVLNGIMEVHTHSKMLNSASLCIVVCGLPDASPLAKEYFPQDCAAATQNILLQALELGLGTCWCGVYPIPDRVSGLQRLLNVSSIPFCLVAVGIPDDNPDPRGFYDPAKVKQI